MGCIATFTDNAVTITHNTNKVLCGTKLPTSNLWTISLPLNSTPAFAAAAALTLSTDTVFVRFTHAALGSPSLSTFVKAVRRGYFHLYPRLTSNILLANPPLTIATAQGHLDQHRVELK